MKEIHTALAANIRRFRKRKALKQRELANLVGCAASYVSALETGACAPSVAVLEKFAIALEVSVIDLFSRKAEIPGSPLDKLVPVLNDPAATALTAPSRRGKRQLETRDGLYIPNVLAQSCFALYLSDDSMAPEFGKGELVTFSLSRKPADGQACLVDTGKGQVLFRTVLAIGKGRWRLQASNPNCLPVLVSAGKKLKMWPAVGHWRTLGGEKEMVSSSIPHSAVKRVTHGLG